MPPLDSFSRVLCLIRVITMITTNERVEGYKPRVHDS
jgi:hypothetical protein